MIIFTVVYQRHPLFIFNWISFSILTLNPVRTKVKAVDTKQSNLFDQLSNYLAHKGLKRTHQRDLISKIFFSSPHKHFRIEEILEKSRILDSSISYATVYRTLMMFVDAGVAKQRQFGKGQSLFEQAAIGHHDHLICTECGSIVEFENEAIEELQEKIAKKHSFKLMDHKMELYGLCSKCLNK